MNINTNNNYLKLTIINKRKTNLNLTYEKLFQLQFNREKIAAHLDFIPGLLYRSLCNISNQYEKCSARQQHLIPVFPSCSSAADNCMCYCFLHCKASHR